MVLCPHIEGPWSVWALSSDLQFIACFHSAGPKLEGLEPRLSEFQYTMTRMAIDLLLLHLRTGGKTRVHQQEVNYEAHI